MAQKTHLTKQEELTTERGVQMRTTDPLTPVLDQLWLNKTSNTLKYFDGSLIQTISGGVPGPVTATDDERAWGGLLQQISDAEINLYNSQPGPLTIIDTMGKAEGILNNLIKSGSALTWANGQNSGTYVRDREVTTLVNKVTGVIVADIRAFAPKAVAITPSTSDVAPVITFYGDVTQYFPTTKPVMVFKNTITDNLRVHRHLIYQGKIALLNVTSVVYNSGPDTTSVTLANPNALDISIGVAQANYTANLRLAPWDATVEARAVLLGAYDTCDLKTGFCEGSIRMYSQQLMQAVTAPGASLLNSHWYHSVKFSPSKQYGTLKIAEIFNVGGNDRVRKHWWWTANGGQTWTKFAFTYELPNNYGMFSQPDLWGSSHPIGGKDMIVADNGKAIFIFGTGHPSNGQILTSGYYANLSDVTPTMVAVPYDGGGGAGTLWYTTSYGGYNFTCDGTKDTMSAFAMSFHWYVGACDIRQRVFYFTWAGASPVFQWVYSDWGNNSPDQEYSLFLYRKPDLSNHVVFTDRYICSSGSRDFGYWLADTNGATFFTSDAGSQANDYRPLWHKETTNYVVWAYYRVSGNPYQLLYFHKNTPETVVRITDGYGFIGTWTSGVGNSYGSNSVGNYGSEVGHNQEMADRCLVSPVDEKRILFLLTFYDGNQRKHALMEVDDFTNPAFPVEYQTARNDWYYLGDISGRTELAQVFQWNSGTRKLRSVMLGLIKNSTGYTWAPGENMLTVEIQEVTGGVTGFPNGTVVATSTRTLDASKVDYNHNDHNMFWFPFASGLTLTNGNYYAIVLKQSVAPASNFFGNAGTNYYIGWRSYSSNNYSRGHACQYNGSVWSDLGANPSQDFVFICSPNFIQDLDENTGYESSKLGQWGDFDGHSLMCQTGPYECEWAYRTKRSNNQNTITLGGHIWRRKITMQVNANDCFTMTDRTPLGYAGEGIDYDPNLAFNWAPGDPASLRKFRTGVNDLGRYVEENGHLGLYWNTYFGAEPGGLRVADPSFQLGYGWEFGNGLNAIRWSGDQADQHNTWNYNYRGHLFAIEAEISPTNAIGSPGQVSICATHGVGSGWWFGFYNGYLCFYNSAVGYVAWANDVIGPNTYHKVRVMKNYVTKKYHLFRSTVAPYTVFTEVASYQAQNIDVGASGSDAYFSVGCWTDGSARFWGRMGYVKMMHGPVRPYMNYNAGTGFYEPFAYSGYKNHSPINRQRPMYGDANGNAKWMALRFPHYKYDNNGSMEVVEIGAQNLSIVDSYRQILTYEKPTLTTPGQEPGIKLTMNRSGSQNANRIAAMGFEFNGD